MEKVKIPYAFLTSILVLWATLLIPTLYLSKAESFLLFHLPGNVATYRLAGIYTEIGNGLFVLFVATLIAITKKLKWAILLIIGFGISGLGVQLTKRTIFKDCSRPVAWFEQQKLELNVPDFLEVSRNNSFPSGHSTTAAILFTFFAYRTRNQKLHLLLALLLFSVAYTRVYLFQHFPIDILTGIGIGVLFHCIVEFYFSDKMTKAIFQKPLIK